MHKKVLVVEDDPDVQSALADALDLLGYKVDLANNGQEALDRLNMQEPPCVILLDLMMPVMNGWQFRTQQQANPKIASVPVVVVSADGNVQQKAASIGANHYLKKPVELQDLAKITQQFCP